MRPNEVAKFEKLPLARPGCVVFTRVIRKTAEQRENHADDTAAATAAANSLAPRR
jgi:hypothetical protein